MNRQELQPSRTPPQPVNWVDRRVLICHYHQFNMPFVFPYISFRPSLVIPWGKFFLQKRIQGFTGKKKTHTRNDASAGHLIHLCRPQLQPGFKVDFLTLLHTVGSSESHLNQLLEVALGWWGCAWMRWRELWLLLCVELFLWKCLYLEAYMVTISQYVFIKCCFFFSL